MKQLTSVLVMSILVLSNLYAQNLRVAELQEDGTIEVENLGVLNEESYTRSTFSQLPDFPFVSLAHPSFKNFRNVTIANIDENEDMEIIVCLNETLYALKSDGTTKWQYTLEGTSNFPPAVADIDGDGDLEIAVQKNFRKVGL